MLKNVTGLLYALKRNPVVWTYGTQRLTHINEQRAPFKICSNISPTVQNAYENIAFSPNSRGVWRINQLMFIQCFREQKHRISTKYYCEKSQEAGNEKPPSHKGKEFGACYLSNVPLTCQVFHLGRPFLCSPFMLLRVTFQQLLTRTSINSFPYHQAAGKNIIILLIPSCIFFFFELKEKIGKKVH